MIRADDLPAAILARLGITKPKGRAHKADEDSADRDFLFQCKALGLPAVTPQWRYPKSDGSGKWKVDAVFPDQMLMVEIDGGIWIKGAHSHPLDILRNMTKGNDAVLAGFSVLHFTPQEVKSGHAIRFTQEVLKARGWENSSTSNTSSPTV